MTTWWWPTQSRILVRVAAPSFSISPTARVEPSRRRSRSRASTRAYTLTFDLPDGGGLAGEDADGLDLADAERVGVAVEEQLVGDGTDLVVERLEDQGVAGGFEVGGAEEVGGLGVGQGDVPTGLGVVLAVFVVSGSYAAIAWATSRSTIDRAAGAAVGELFVDPDRRGLGQPVGLAGDPAGLPGRHLEPTDAFPEEGEAVAQVEGVGDQLCPGRRGHAQRQRERFGGERGHGRGAVPAERLVGQQGGTAERLDTGVGGGGVEVGPVGGELELAERALRVRLCSLSAAASSTPAGSRSPTSYSSRTVVLMGLSQASTTDSRGRESPVSTGDSRIVTYL